MEDKGIGEGGGWGVVKGVEYDYCVRVGGIENFSAPSRRSNVG